MAAMVQKKISFDRKQAAFLAACKDFGFEDQSSLVRTAVDDFMKEIKRRRLRAQIAAKAAELYDIYRSDKELTAFTAIDGDDFHEPGRNLDH